MNANGLMEFEGFQRDGDRLVKYIGVGFAGESMGEFILDSGVEVIPHQVVTADRYSFRNAFWNAALAMSLLKLLCSLGRRILHK